MNIKISGNAKLGPPISIEDAYEYARAYAYDCVGDRLFKGYRGVIKVEHDYYESILIGKPCLIVYVDRPDYQIPKIDFDASEQFIIRVRVVHWGWFRTKLYRLFNKYKQTEFRWE